MASKNRHSPCQIAWLVLPFVALAFDVSSAEYFTALSDMARVVDIERRLAASLGEHVQHSESRLAQLRPLLKELRLGSSAALLSFVRNGQLVSREEWWHRPTSAFVALSRLVRLQESLKKHFRSGKLDDPNKGTVYRAGKHGKNQSEGMSPSLTSLLSHYKPYLPTQHDKHGAIQAILRLQQTYHLPSRRFFMGQVGQHALPLSTKDCFAIGVFAYSRKEFAKAVLWFREALEQWPEQAENAFEDQHESHKKNLVDVLFHLVFSEWKVGNISGAVKLNEHILRLDPGHEDAVANAKYFARRSIASRETNSSDTVRQDFPKTQFRALKYNTTKESWTQEVINYETLCRSKRRQPRNLHTKLKCFYSDNHRMPRLLLRPAKVEVVSVHPNVVLYRNVISDLEIEFLKTKARPLLARATIINKPGLLSYIDDVRISKSAWLEEKNDQSGILQRLNNRIEDITGLTVTTAEEYQVVNYGIGGQYEPHFDFARKHEDMFTVHGPFGNRIATFLFYMANVKGGATVFTQNGAQVYPTKGDASFWYNLLPSGERDYRTRHAGCPVLAGSKWVCNKWIHVVGQEFRKPCRLHADSDWDITTPPRVPQ